MAAATQPPLGPLQTPPVFSPLAATATALRYFAESHRASRSEPVGHFSRPSERVWRCTGTGSQTRSAFRVACLVLYRIKETAKHDQHTTSCRWLHSALPAELSGDHGATPSFVASCPDSFCAGMDGAGCGACPRAPSQAGQGPAAAHDAGTPLAQFAIPTWMRISSSVRAVAVAPTAACCSDRRRPSQRAQLPASCLPKCQPCCLNTLADPARMQQRLLASIRILRGCHGTNAGLPVLQQPPAAGQRLPSGSAGQLVF